MNKFNLQLFADAETGTVVTTDLDPAISIDLSSRLAGNIKTLNAIITANELVPMASGTVINMYETKIKGNKPAQVAEGETIGLTQVERKLKKSETITLNKYRKKTTAEAIQRVGREQAINATDEVVVKAIQKDIKASFFSLLATGTGSASPVADGVQAALAAAWGAIQAKFDDVDATPIFFVSSTDVAAYLAKASVTMQTAFGLSYIENFLGLGDAFVSPALEAGTVVATAKENLFCAYVPASSGDVAETFGLTSDETGLIGMVHAADTTNASIETLMMSGVKFFPEDLSAVIKVKIAAAAAGTE